MKSHHLSIKSEQSVKKGRVFPVHAMKAYRGGRFIAAHHLNFWDAWWCSWLRHCAASRKVASLIPDGVIGIFHWHNPPGRTKALGLTQTLTEMSIRNISWGVKAAGAWGWQLYRLHVLIVLKSGSLNLLEPSGPVQACNGIALPFFLNHCTTGWWGVNFIPWSLYPRERNPVPTQ